MTRRRRMQDPHLTVIWWRDIPAQVTARAGDRIVSATLPSRFQAAIDRVAMRDGLAGTDAYLSAWERHTRPCGSDLQAEVDAEVAALIDRHAPRAPTPDTPSGDTTTYREPQP